MSVDHLSFVLYSVPCGSLTRGAGVILGIASSYSPAFVTVEVEFTRWAMITFLFEESKVEPVTLRKSTGSLAGIKQPYFNFTAQDPSYFNKVSQFVDQPYLDPKLCIMSGVSFLLR